MPEDFDEPVIQDRFGAAVRGVRLCVTERTVRRIMSNAIEKIRQENRKTENRNMKIFIRFEKACFDSFFVT